MYDPRVGRRFIPSHKARIPHEAGGYLMRANGSGFRNDFEFADSATPGKRIFLLFGASFTAGEGVPNGCRYGDCLTKLVPQLEVYNYGMPMTGPDQQYLTYKEFA